MVVGVRTRANQANATTAFINCTDLSFTLVPNFHYYFRFVGAYTAALATVGLQLSVNGPASPAFVAFIGQIHTGLTAVFGGVGGAYDAAIAATVGSIVPMPFMIEGSVSNGPNEGLLSLRFRSEQAGQAVNILRGSIGLLVAVDG